MLLRKSGQCLLGARSLSKARLAVFSGTTLAAHPRRELPAHTRRISTPSIPLSDATIGPLEIEPIENAETPADDKPPGRKRRPVAPKPPTDKATDTLPPGLGDEVIWQHDFDRSPLGLPTEVLFQDALTNLLSTLHPQTQHRAAYTTSAGPQAEPTLALYCPLEASPYIIDNTVQELASRTNCDVLVINALDLIAGECGRYGKAASCLQLPRNSLQKSGADAPTSGPPPSERDRNEDDSEPHFLRSSPGALPNIIQMTGSMPFFSSSQPRRIVVGSPPRLPPPSKVKAFFDELVNLTPSNPPSKSPAGRLIYIRNFELIADSLSTWYPDLLAAVRQRRQGPIAPPSSAVQNPTTIIFGVTPSPLLSTLVNEQEKPQQKTLNDATWEESPEAEKERERELKARLRQWEKGDVDQLVESALASDASMNEPTGMSPMVLIASLAPGLMPRAMGEAGASPFSSSSRRGNMDHDGLDFFRTSALLPQIRSEFLERRQRTMLRRDINLLNIRLAISSAGGLLEEDWPHPIVDSGPWVGGATSPEMDSEHPMFWEWGVKVEAWPVIKAIADRAVASAFDPQIVGLDSTPISWQDVISAWMSTSATRSSRRESIRSFIQKEGETLEDLDEEEDDKRRKTQVDDVIERVKNDPELDTHEQRLLTCIVDAASMPTTFNQVHLPDHTIDSVRTLVSLPLLHPSAFDHGILKHHGMTGALLFGPPGTGKTLCIRALARESGARMMLVKPSDVMDMYVGEGEKLVRSVFSLARRLSPCVIFLDEIDALFGARMSARDTGGAIAHRGVITEFMQEMDGLKNNKSGSVIVIGATNRPFDLDDAVLRRLPRRLLVDLPGEKEREAILGILLKDETLAPNIDLNSLAKRTESFSGSDLKHLCVAAALDAVKEMAPVPWRPTIRQLAAPDTLLDVVNNLEQPSVATNSAEVDSSESTSSLFPDPSATASSEPITSTSLVPTTPPPPPPPLPPRILALHHFQKALSEITPSASESLGSLSDLRKWNEEFGEGARRKKGRRIWGGKFGFWQGAEGGAVQEEGRVLVTSQAEDQLSESGRLVVK